MESHLPADAPKQNPLDTLITPEPKYFGPYMEAMASETMPVTADPETEVHWVAFNMAIPRVDYRLGPSKVAVRWLRELRLRSRTGLREKFWGETWAGYMNRRLALTLPSTTVVPSGVRENRRVGIEKATIAGLRKSKGGENADV